MERRKVIRLILGALSVAGVLLVGQWAFLSGKNAFFNDSYLSIFSFHVILGSLLDGTLPLWSPETNAGEILWPLIETAPFIDPIPIVVYALCQFFELSSVVAHQWTAILWLLAFGVGASLLSRFWHKDFYLNLTVAIVLVGGALDPLINKQLGGFIFPFRYLPFVFLSWLVFLKRPSKKQSIILAIALSFSYVGFMGIYAYLFQILFFACTAFQKRKILNKAHLHGLLVTAVIFMPTTAPSIVAGWELTHMVPVNRGATHAHFYLSYDRLRSLFPYFDSQPDTWYGSLFMGTLPALLTLFSILTLKKQSPTFKIWSLLTLIALIFSFGLVRGLLGTPYFLGVRHWGFALVFVLLGFTQMMVLGSQTIFQRLKPGRGALISFLICLTTLIEILFFARHQSFFSTYSPQIGSEMPSVGFQSPKWQAIRAFEYDQDEFGAMALLAPRILARPVAIMPKFGLWDRTSGQITHLLEQKRFAILKDLNLSMGLQKTIFGVHRPIIDTIQSSHVVRDLEEAKSALVQLSHKNQMGTTVIEANKNEWTLDPKSTTFASGIKVNGYTLNTLSFTVISDQQTGIVIRDGYDPRWRATIDGIPTQVFAANLNSKALLVPKGQHRVDLEYHPSWYLLMFWLRLVAYAGGFISLGALYLREAKRFPLLQSDPKNASI